jgi:hypothetical protein
MVVNKSFLPLFKRSLCGWVTVSRCCSATFQSYAVRLWCDVVRHTEYLRARKKQRMEEIAKETRQVVLRLHDDGIYRFMIVLQHA